MRAYVDVRWMTAGDGCVLGVVTAVIVGAVIVYPVVSAQGLAAIC